MEEIKVTTHGALFKDPNNIELFLIDVTADKYKLVRSKLVSERQKIIEYLKDLKDKGEIKSFLRPKNKKIQKHLDEICLIKRNMKKSIEKLDVIYK